jgi:hypothetical protein
MKRIVLALVVVVGLLACERAPREDVVQQEQSLEACGHPICAVGGPLVAACDACATVLCAADPYCCSTEWDATCVGEVASICQKSCTAPLTSGCDACVTQLCAADPYCCASEWDATCVTEVTSICGKPCL